MHDRDALRIRLGRRHPVRITLRQNGKMLLDGPADNLSISGAGFHVRPTGEKFPLRGERYGTCRITLPDRQSIFCQATVVHGHYDEETGYTLLGVEFIDIEPGDERRLQRFISGVEMASRKLARLDDAGTLPVMAYRKTRKPPLGAGHPARHGKPSEHVGTLTALLTPCLTLMSTLRDVCRDGWQRLSATLKPGRRGARPKARQSHGLPPALAALIAAKAVMASGSKVPGGAAPNAASAHTPATGRPAPNTTTAASIHPLAAKARPVPAATQPGPPRSPVKAA